MARISKYEMQYAMPQKDGSFVIKTIRFDGDDKLKKNKDICRDAGFEIVSITKLYPFSTMKNQHNFDLIHSICFNHMCDMESGEIEWDDKTYEALEEMRQDAEEFFTLPLPVAWLPYDKWSRATELARIAVMHRDQRCIEAGRSDLLKYND